ncbi:MAG TPA: hypothetical protein VJT71_08225, partial [Pyrinomonadaceae bacterium]|nr:hypothetical protein [Pyrinomonadaceae bacterium]
MFSARLDSQFWTATLKIGAIALLALVLAGCSTFASRGNTGVVVSRTAQIRSSTAVVAADLLEVSRGDTVDIVDSQEVPDPTDNSKKELWYRVRAQDVDKTEGWIEARNVMPEDVLEKSRKLAEEDKDTQSQATGQLHASSNLRLTPDRSNNENIMMRLDSGSSFEIVGWRRVPKLKGLEPSESDTAPKRGTASTDGKRLDRSADEDQESQETTELWYKVRISPAISPAPGGW